MERDRSFQSSRRSGLSLPGLFATEPIRPDSLQKELFAQEVLWKAGGPHRILIPDPNHPGKPRLFVVASAQMKALLGLLEEIAATDETVLILGESGTGKNWLVRLLHALSGRREEPLIEFSPSHHQSGLIDSALFGHEKGAYTGATEARAGELELAEGGTFFINEAGDLPLELQAKLLQFLDDRVFKRIGGARLIKSDVRVVAATHRDLWGMVKEGEFREDLYHRLNAACLQVPPLRERPEDVAPIARAILEEVRILHRKPALAWSDVALETLARCPLAGNVRALRNAIVAMVIRSKGAVLEAEDIPDELLAEGAPDAPEKDEAPPADQIRERFIRAHVACRGNRSAIARLLGWGRVRVRNKIRLYKLEEPSQG